MKPRVLCVDDEPHVLDGLRDNLRRDFDVVVTAGGEAALAELRDGEPFAVVVSDMRMPNMNGAAFLAEARRCWPDTVRMLLTGYAEIDAALAAVNEGGIFRFLMKPCSAEGVAAAVADAAEQHRMITAERVLLEQTLTGSIKALTDVLSLVNPVAFGRANRLKQYAAELASELGSEDAWAIEVAASVSQLGCAALPPETALAYYEGRPWSREDQERIAHLPDAAANFLASIPRMGAVCDILRSQNRTPSTAASGARVLRIVHDFDVLTSGGHTTLAAVATMRGRTDCYDADMLEAFATLRHCEEQRLSPPMTVRLRELRVGMEFADDVRTPTGALLIARGHQVTTSLLERLATVDDAVLDSETVVLTRHAVGGVSRHLELQAS